MTGTCVKTTGKVYENLLDLKIFVSFSDSSDNESSAEGSTGKSSKSGGSANGSALDTGKQSKKSLLVLWVDKSVFLVVAPTQNLKQISGPMNGSSGQSEEAQPSDELVSTMWLGTEDGW